MEKLIMTSHSDILGKETKKRLEMAVKNKLPYLEDFLNIILDSICFNKHILKLSKNKRDESLEEWFAPFKALDTLLASQKCKKLLRVNSTKRQGKKCQVENFINIAEEEGFILFALRRQLETLLRTSKKKKMDKKLLDHVNCLINELDSLEKNEDKGS